MKHINTSVLVTGAAICLQMFVASPALAACKLSGMSGKTHLCADGKALYYGMDKPGMRGTWKKVTGGIKLCLPDESGRFGCEIRKGVKVK